MEVFRKDRLQRNLQEIESIKNTEREDIKWSAQYLKHREFFESWKKLEVYLKVLTADPEIRP